MQAAGRSTDEGDQARVMRLSVDGRRVTKQRQRQEAKGRPMPQCAGRSIAHQAMIAALVAAPPVLAV